MELLYPLEKGAGLGVAAALAGSSMLRFPGELIALGRGVKVTLVVTNGCLRSFLALGRSFGSRLKHWSKKSFASGEKLSGICGISVEVAI